MKKILVTGGSGFVGRALAGYLRDEGYEPLIFSRSGSPSTVVPDSQGLIPAEILAQLCGIVNLAGENIAQRWNAAVKARILASRVDTTGRIVAALRRNRQAGLAVPAVLVSASAVGYYGNRPPGLQTEDSPSGGDFLALVCRQWEQAAWTAADEGVRVVVFRFGIVLGADGGVLSRMARPFRWGVGGVIGDGRQHISWIHRLDLVRALALALDRPDMSGPYNLTSPNPVTMERFMSCLGRALDAASWTRLPGGLVRLVLGEMADELLLADQQVLPRRLVEQGFAFAYPDLDQALADVYRTVP